MIIVKNVKKWLIPSEKINKMHKIATKKRCLFFLYSFLCFFFRSCMFFFQASSLFKKSKFMCEFCMNERVSERVSDITTSEWLTECVNEWMCECKKIVNMWLRMTQICCCFFLYIHCFVFSLHSSDACYLHICCTFDTCQTHLIW